MKTASELIQMLRDVEMNFSRLYANVATIEGQYNPRLKTAAMVLSHQESDHAKAYDDMQKTLREKGDLRLSETFHEKARALLHDFRHGVATRYIPARCWAFANRMRRHETGAPRRYASPF